MQTENVINIDELYERVAGDEELLHEIIELFMEDYNDHLDNINQAISTNNVELLTKAAHTLKGAVATFAAEQARNAAFTLEKMGRNNDLSGSREANEILLVEIEKLKNALLNLSPTVFSTITKTEPILG